MPWYKTGTVSVEAGSTVVTGVGTLFASAVLRGEALKLKADGQLYEIEEVINSTTLLLAEPYAGATASGQEYSILPIQDYMKILAARAAALLDQVENQQLPPVHEERIQQLEQGHFVSAPGMGLSEVNFTTGDSVKLTDLPTNSALQTQLGQKVDKVEGKGLTTNDFTDVYRDKLAGLEGSHFRGTFVSLAALQSAIPVGNAGDYADVDGGSGQDVLRYIWDVNDAKWVAQSGTATPITAAQVKTLYESNPDTNAFRDADVAKLAALGPTDLAVGTRTATTLQVTSSTGADVDLPVATVTQAGLLSAADKDKLDKSSSGGSGELFNYAWHNGPRSSIDVGRVATDGQQLLLLTHPDVCQAIWAGKQHAVDESVWQADPTKRNCWSRGDGTSWVRVPDLNAAVAGTGKPFYLRGGPDSLNGTSVGDAIRNITGTASASGVWGLLADSANVTGPFGIAPYSAQYKDLAGGGFASTVGRALTFDVSKAVPTADENRVKTAYGVMTVRVFTEVSNVGALDAGQLATQLGVVDAKVQALDANAGFTIIYPNGGTAAAPANVAANTRYVMPNPFPGFHVMCVAELLIGGTWGETGWAYASAGGYGTKASQSSSEGIVVQTGNAALAAIGRHTGGIFTSEVTTPTPCRVKVWKLKGGI
jgi:hypothetical protein